MALPNRFGRRNVGNVGGNVTKPSVSSPQSPPDFRVASVKRNPVRGTGNVMPNTNMTRGSFIRGAGIAAGSVLAAGIGLGGTASAQAIDNGDGSCTVSQGISVDELQQAILDFSIVNFEPGQYLLEKYVECGAVLEISKSVTLRALNPLNKPQLKIRNTAFVQDNFIAMGIRVNAPEADVNFENLIIDNTRELHVVALNNCIMLGLEVTNTGPYAFGESYGIHFGGNLGYTSNVPDFDQISGTVIIQGCKIKGVSGGLGILCNNVYEDTALIRTEITANFTIEGNEIIGNDFGFVIGDYYYAIAGGYEGNHGDYIIRNNLIKGAFAALFHDIQETVLLSQNKIIAEGYFLGTTIGVISYKNSTSSQLTVKGNDITSVTPYGFGALFGYPYPSYNVIFRNNLLNGGPVYIGIALGLGGLPAENCLVFGNDLSSLPYLLGPYYVGENATNNIIKGSTENAIILNPQNSVSGIIPNGIKPGLGPELSLSLKRVKCILKGGRWDSYTNTCQY